MIKYRVYKRDPSLVHNRIVYYICITNKGELLKYDKESKIVSIHNDMCLTIFMDTIFNINHPVFIKGVPLDTRFYNAVDYQDVIFLKNLIDYNIKEKELHNQINTVLKNILLFWDEWYD